MESTRKFAKFDLRNLKHKDYHIRLGYPVTIAILCPLFSLQDDFQNR